MVDFNPSFNDAGSLSQDQLIAGDHPIRTAGVTIASGAGVLTRGTLLGMVTATGKYVISAAEDDQGDPIADGSETPVVILGEDVDASAADVDTWAYIAGDFNENQMTFGTGHTADSVRDGLRGRSIYLHKPVVAE